MPGKKSSKGKNAEPGTNVVDASPKPKIDLAVIQYVALLISIFGSLVFTISNSNNNRSELLTEIRDLRSEIRTLNTQLTAIRGDIHTVDTRVIKIEDRLGLKVAQPLQVSAIIAPAQITLGEMVNVQVAFTNINPFPMDNACSVYLSYDDEAPEDDTRIYPVQLAASENRTFSFVWNTYGEDLALGIHTITVAAIDCPDGLNKSSTNLTVVSPLLTETPTATP